MSAISLRDRNMRRALLPGLLASSMLSGVTAALAQGQQGQLETVVVTATKRSENLQNVPFSIQAIGTERLEQLQIQGFTDYVKYLPAVTFQPGGTSGGAGGGNGAPGFANVYMRGVVAGGDGNHSGSLPSVGVYLDEQPITTIGGTLNVHIYDIARVESLAGPQGTLYGASSESGTIRLITNQPDPSGFEASYDVQGNHVDHGDFGYILEGMVNQPIAENVAIRLVAWDEHDAGFIDNVPGTRFFPTAGITINNYKIAENNFNDADTIGGRLALRYDIDKNWTITPSIVAQEEKSNGVFSWDPSVGYLEVNHFLPEFVHDGWWQAALTVQGKIANLDLVYSGGYMDRRIREESDYTDYSFWYDTLYGYGAYWTNNAGQPTKTPSQYILAQDHFTKTSHELRLSSPSDERLRFVAGLFYELQTHFILQDYKINGIGTDISVEGWPGTIWLTDQQRTDRDYAAFGEVSYDILPSLTATAGLRVFRAVNSLEGFFGFGSGYSSHTGVSQCFAPPSEDAGPCTNLNKAVTEDGETHKLNLSWHVDPDKMLYATYSTGFRPGGINRRGTIPPYDSDTLDNYEVGWKTTWLNNNLRWNGALFHEVWNNFQYAVLGLNSFTEIHNAGKGVINGIESDVDWLIDDHLSLAGSGSITDANLTTILCGVTNPANSQPVTVCPGPLDPYPPWAPANTQLPVTPKYKGNITARYQWNIADFLTHVQLSLVSQSSSWADLRIQAPNPVTGEETPIRSALGKQAGFTTLDFAVGVERDNWHAELFVQNLFDAPGNLFSFPMCTTQVCERQTYETPITPRMVGIKFGQKF
jgi:outer membrane receptor protein involved in Fe transport